MTEVYFYFEISVVELKGAEMNIKIRKCVL